MERRTRTVVSDVPDPIENSTKATYLQIVIPFVQATRVNELQTLLHRLRRDQLR